MWWFDCHILRHGKCDRNLEFIFSDSHFGKLRFGCAHVVCVRRADDVRTRTEAGRRVKAQTVRLHARHQQVRSRHSTDALFEQNLVVDDEVGMEGPDHTH